VERGKWKGWKVSSNYANDMQAYRQKSGIRIDEKR
jgi:hypothetical protein